MSVGAQKVSKSCQRSYKMPPKHERLSEIKTFNNIFSNSWMVEVDLRNLWMEEPWIPMEIGVSKNLLKEQLLV